MKFVFGNRLKGHLKRKHSSNVYCSCCKRLAILVEFTLEQNKNSQFFVEKFTKFVPAPPALLPNKTLIIELIAYTSNVVNIMPKAAWAPT
jgi:hypothetical protein